MKVVATARIVNAFYNRNKSFTTIMGKFETICGSDEFIVENKMTAVHSIPACTLCHGRLDFVSFETIPDNVP